jgi:hypothetical protein
LADIADIGTGTLEAYWEQGWEGRIAYAFAPDVHESHPVFLEQGDRLTIWNVKGEVIWQGVIDFVPVRWWERRPPDHVQVWAYEKQRGVRYADWLLWFWQHPPMRATLESKD